MAETRDDIMERSTETLQTWRDNAETYYADIQERFSGIDSRVREVVKARPLVCVAGAFAVGFLIARSVRQWRRGW